MKKIFSMCLSLLMFNSIITSTSLAINPPHIQEENQGPMEQEFEILLNRYCNSGVSKEEVYEICDDAIKVLERESSLLEINGPTIVVGDLHGDVKALEYCCKTYFLDGLRNGQNILFLGDYVDRGENGIEVASLLLKLKIMFPGKVFLLRGNHESINMNKVNGFDKECKKKYGHDGDNVLEKVNDAFNYLSLAAVVNKDTFCVHGGISPCLSNDISTIGSISKPYFADSKKTSELVTDLLWSDPIYLEGRFSFNLKRRAGKVYGKSAVQDFLKVNGLKRIIRAHEVAEEGYKDVFEDGNVITIFSSPGYNVRGRCGIPLQYHTYCKENSGAVALVTNDNIEYKVYTRKLLDTDVTQCKGQMENYEVYCYKNPDSPSLLHFDDCDNSKEINQIENYFANNLESYLRLWPNKCKNSDPPSSFYDDVE